MVFYHWRIFKSNCRKLGWMGFKPGTTEFRSDSRTNWPSRLWFQLLSVRANFAQLFQFYLFLQCSRFILVFVLVSRHICFKWSLAQVITLVGEWTDTFGIHHWKIFRNSYGKLAWVGFEPTTTEFCSDSLTDWDMRPWVQLSLRDNFVQPLQFHLFLQCSRLISVFAFVSHQISFKQSLTQVITLVAESIDAYGIHHWRVFRSNYRKLAWLGFEPTTTEFCSDSLTDWAIRPCVQLTLRANFVQLLQFHLFLQCSCLISVFVFVSCHICLKQSLRIGTHVSSEMYWYIWHSPLKDSSK